MVFSSLTFIFYFLPIVLILYYIVPNKFKNIILFLSSLAFYFFAEPKFGILMIVSILSTYIHGILMDKHKEHKKIIMISSIIISLSFLVFFKYTDFIIENVNMLFNGEFDLLNLALPIGISFYTFKMISYIVDVYKNKVKPQKSFLKLATYVSLFPQLMAGPIVRYSTIEKELDDREYTFSKFSNGVRRFIIGLSKKVLIADVLGDLISSFNMASEKTVLFYWIYAVAITLQIYFDFSGYSDMAIGLGKMFGFNFPENFNYPYISRSVTDFWRRWHITLGTWFRDYVYIPLGGNRKGLAIQIRNILIVWFLTGAWHGASWNFILWGVYFGIILILEKLFLLKFLEKLPKIIRHIYSIVVILISWVIFAFEDLSKVMEYIKAMFINTNLWDSEAFYYLQNYGFIICIGVICSIPVWKKLKEKIDSKNSKTLEVITSFGYVAILVLSTASLVTNSFNPFLYFRF